MTDFGAKSDWPLAAFAVVTSIGKNWGGSRPTGPGFGYGHIDWQELGWKAIRLLSTAPASIAAP